jgi:hypothetical protein
LLFTAYKEFQSLLYTKKNSGLHKNPLQQGWYGSVYKIVLSDKRKQLERLLEMKKHRFHKKMTPVSKFNWCSSKELLFR